MGFKQLDPEDLVISSEAVTTTVWSNNNPTLTTYFTSSTQVSSNVGNYYYSIYNLDTSNPSSALQFSIAYCDLKGSGSLYYNPTIPEATPSRTNYGQYRALVLGDENSEFTFGNYTSEYFYAISVERARYKESLLPGTMTINLSGSGLQLQLTDDSKITPSIVYKDAGRVFNMVSGSAGNVYTGVNQNGWSANSGSYGWFLPDIGTILLNGAALDATAIGGGISLSTGRAANTNDTNPSKLFTRISGSGALGRGFTMNSQETLTSDYVFIRARNAEFNYSENPSFISGSTGAVLFDTFINNPQIYITTVGMYNDNNELLAVAKLSRPLKKDFTKELLIRTKLTF
jgi:hypothetical protein